tara:strand:- start:22 stop:189 length:168 start_codon:yes stop_codon:yes gene_type:complete
MAEPLYTVEEMQTDGWKAPFQECANLTKEQATEQYNNLVNMEGIAPQRLRITRVS